MQRPGFTAVPTVVGSFPHTDARALTDSILARFAEMPAWPQMPARDWRESMYVQYSEGLPGAVLDGQEQRIYFRGGDTLFPELEPFYQALIEEDVERFAITADFARGLCLFLESVPRLDSRPEWVKGQVTGPFSFAMTVTDQDKRSLAYDANLYEVAVNGMAMKARQSIDGHLIEVGVVGQRALSWSVTPVIAKLNGPVAWPLTHSGGNRDAARTKRNRQRPRAKSAVIAKRSTSSSIRAW